MKSGNLNFLEPSGQLQACNGTALPFTFITDLIMIHEILSISFQMLNPMPTETKLQYHQDEQELVHQAVQFYMYKL
jgi:hypothetical protein